MSAASMDSLPDEFTNTDILTAGSWQRRDYASLSGLGTIAAMYTNHCVVFEVLSKTCKSCEANENKKASINIRYLNTIAKLTIMVL